MKITLVDGKIVDTYKLNDKDAILHEALNNLYKACEQYNATAFARIVLNDKSNIGMVHIPKENGETSTEGYLDLVQSLSKWLQESSRGRLLVIDTQQENGENQNTEFED